MKIGNNIDLLLNDYFRGTLAPEKAVKVEEWIEESPENRAIADQVCRLYCGNSAENTDDIDVEVPLASALRSLKPSKCRHYTSAFQRVSACLAIPLLGLACFFAWKYYSPGECEMTQIRTTTGMVSEAVLPDGTVVWLNSNSTLSYPTRFNSNTRRVKLEGEAFFDVTKTGQKFIVDARSVSIEVLGTRFDVAAYQTSPEIKATLVSGKILLSYEDKTGTSHNVSVNPGERYSYNCESDSLECRRVNTACLTSWREGKIWLDDTPLADALEAIGNRYNVEFLVRNEKLYVNRYTGVFTDQRLDVIMKHFCRTTNIHFEVLSDSIPETVCGRQKILVY